MKIGVNDARAYFAHPSQQLDGITPDNLPSEGVEYWAHDDVCCVFHPAPYPDVWMVHVAMKPEGRGVSDVATREILTEFWNEKRPIRIVGWMNENRRAVLSFAARLGFVRDGVMPVPGGNVVMEGWTP